MESFYVEDPQLLQDAQERLKKILGAKYEKADLSEVAHSQDGLSEEQQASLQGLLTFEVRTIV